MKVLIIEDEVAAARGLIKQLKSIDDTVEVIKTLKSVKESVDWFEQNPHPPLVFLDIELQDGNSLKIFDRVTVNSQIIFCTAYEQYAIEAFKLNSLHYLLKPIDPVELEESLNRCRMMLASDLGLNESIRGLIDSLSNQSVQYKKRFLVKAGSKYFYIRTEEISHFHTEEKLNFLVTFDGRKHVIDEYLDELQTILDPSFFYRINRQSIIHLNAIDRIEKDYGKYDVLTKNSERMPVSKTRLAGFKEWLNQ